MSIVSMIITVVVILVVGSFVGGTIAKTTDSIFSTTKEFLGVGNPELRDLAVKYTQTGGLSATYKIIGDKDAVRGINIYHQQSSNGSFGPLGNPLPINNPVDGAKISDNPSAGIHRVTVELLYYDSGYEEADVDDAEIVLYNNVFIEKFRNNGLVCGNLCNVTFSKERALGETGYFGQAATTDKKTKYINRGFSNSLVSPDCKLDRDNKPSECSPSDIAQIYLKTAEFYVKEHQIIGKNMPEDVLKVDCHSELRDIWNTPDYGVTGMKEVCDAKKALLDEFGRMGGVRVAEVSDPSLAIGRVIPRLSDSSLEYARQGELRVKYKIEDNSIFARAVNIHVREISGAFMESSRGTVFSENSVIVSIPTQPGIYVADVELVYTNGLKASKSDMIPLYSMEFIERFRPLSDFACTNCDVIGKKEAALEVNGRADINVLGNLEQGRERYLKLAYNRVFSGASTDCSLGSTSSVKNAYFLKGCSSSDIALLYDAAVDLVVNDYLLGKPSAEILKADITKIDCETESSVWSSAPYRLSGMELVCIAKGNLKDEFDKIGGVEVK